MAGGVRWSNEQSPKCFIEERKEMGKEGGGLPCSGSWFCGGGVPKGVGDEDGEVE